MALSAPGIGSNLDVNSIISQLMAVEQRPLARLVTKEAAFQSKLTALGSLKGALSSLQSAINTLNDPARFQAMSGTSSDTKIVKMSTTGQAAPGTYNVNVTQLAQGQTLVSQGSASSTTTIGTGAATAISFQFGTVEGGEYLATSSPLARSVASNGIPANSLSINGTTISTDNSVTSAKLLADRINLATASNGVTASASTDTGAMGSFTTLSGTGTYTLSVAGVTIISGAAAGTNADAIDARLADSTVAANLTAAGITVSGSAGNGDLKFTRADGSNISIQESGTDITGGFTGSVGIGKTVTHTGAVTLSAATAIEIGGSNPGIAGFTSGVQPNTFSGAGFTQNPDITGGTITIDGTNNTLQGIRDAINKANIGVTASIVSDGSAQPHRLIITSTKTGAASSMKITVDGDAAINDLLAFDPTGNQKMRQTSAAQDTLLSVNGIAVRSAKHEIADAIQGVTLTAVTTGSSTISVTRDTASITSAVNAFVKAYNDASKTMRDLTAYNPETRQGAALTGDSTVRAIQTNLRSLLGSNVTGNAGGFSHLSQIGVSFQTDGTLSVDSSKLQKAISENVDDIGALFATMGKATDSLIKYKSSSTATQAGTYEVFVTSLATQGKMVGSAASGLTITQGVNDKLSVSVNGVNATITLTAGTYTVDSLVSHVQTAINGDSTLSKAGVSVDVSANAGVLTVMSNSYGSASKVTITGNGADSLLGAGRTATDGADVAGTIGGVAAQGSGQDLIGATGSAAEGLRMTVTGGAENAARGTITFSHGYGKQLGRLVETYLGSNGLISDRTEGLNSSIKDLGRQREAINRQLEVVEKRYRAQFAALDAMISSMNQTSTYLAQQLANLPKIE